MATSMLSRAMLDFDTPVMGPEVSFGRWADETEHDQLTARLVRDRIEKYGADNVLLVGRRVLSSVRRDQLEAAVGSGRFTDVRDTDTGPFLATTASVKGLEAPAVVVIGVDDLESAEARKFLYIACSRASVDLTVLLSHSVEQGFRKGAAWLGERLAEVLKSRPT